MSVGIGGSLHIVDLHHQIVRGIEFVKVDRQLRDRAVGGLAIAKVTAD
jgi:hypothetical protein